ncbi:MAG: polymer-forming cytoskeletal protein [Butyrivibrio sp.]|nr:polymer-forming cytoskeletal protein [Acetatifactor muris]MCM1559077.1 polymer-forming cytoskeletal protein [Butyrivibrio sp.]
MLEEGLDGGQAQEDVQQPDEAVPSDIMQGEAVPDEAAQSDIMQGEAVPDEAAQSDIMQGEAMPDEAAQDETIQYEALQYEAMQDETVQNETIIEQSKGEEEEMDMEDKELARDMEATDETSVITEGMTITGDVSTQGSIDVIGTVNGNIDALGKLNITGHVNGNSRAAEIYAESAKINGEIVSEGAVKIGASSVIIGNITATSAAIAGAVKGDIDVKGPVILDASAIVMGNIKSKSVQINNGAVIEGMCSQCYADVSPTSFFDEYKPEPSRKTKAKQSEQQ